MSQDAAKAKDFSEQSPVTQARAKLDGALERLQEIVHARIEEAARAQAAAATATDSNAGDSEQWQNACRMLEEQLASLKEENSQLHSELHQARAEVKHLHERNGQLESARKTATAALDDAIAAVESALKEA